MKQDTNCREHKRKTLSEMHAISAMERKRNQTEARQRKTDNQVQTAYCMRCDAVELGKHDMMSLAANTSHTQLSRL